MEGPSGNDEYTDLVRYITGFTGSLERKMIAERTKRGKLQIAKTANRIPTGCGRGIYGYDYDTVTKTRSVNESEANIVRMLFRDIIAGKTIFANARELNNEGVPAKSGGKWHPLTIKRILHNQSYYGLDYYNQTRSHIDRDGRRKTVDRPKEEWIEIRGYSPPIITEATFNRAQEQLGRPFRYKGNSKDCTCSQDSRSVERVGRRLQGHLEWAGRGSTDVVRPM